MFRNYLSVALRNFLRSKLQSTLSVLGLTIGFASAIAILVYVQFELSYDSFHPDADRTYRILRDQREDTRSVTSPGTSGALAPALMKEVPEVEVSTRWHTWTSNWAKRPGEVVTKPARPVAWVDANFFKTLGFEMVYGDPTTALLDPGSLVISTDASALFFGSENPIGKTLVLENAMGLGDRTITGVYRLPRNSSLRFNFLMPGSPRGFQFNAWQPEGGGAMACHTFVKLRPGTSLSQLTDRLHDLMERHMGAEVRARDRYRLQPIEDIHLYTEAKFRGSSQNRRVQHGNAQTVYTLMAIAFLIVLIAGANFTNLAMSQSMQRTREVGMRKVSGCSRGQIIGQFVGEAVLLALVSLLLAVGIVLVVLPEFAAFVQRDISLSLGWLSTGALLLLAVGVGTVAGYLPALFLASLDPVAALKGTLNESSWGGVFTKGLIVLQFAISVCLAVGSVVVYQQLRHMQIRPRIQRQAVDSAAPVRPGHGQAVGLGQAARPPLRRRETDVPGSPIRFVRNSLLHAHGRKEDSGQVHCGGRARNHRPHAARGPEFRLDVSDRVVAGLSLQEGSGRR